MSLANLLGVKETPKIKVDDAVVKKTAINPFDFVTAIQQTGEDLIVDERTEKDYNPYIVNRAMSMGSDTTIPANEMNCRNHIPKKAQFQFLMSFVRKRKRYNKWLKAEPEENLKLIQEYYGYNIRKARAALTILSPEEIESIKDKMRKGGIDK